MIEYDLLGKQMEHDYSAFRTQVRRLATKRARRFGLNITRTTIEVNTKRRKSVDLGTSAATGGGSGTKSAAAGAVDATAPGLAAATAAATAAAADSDGGRALPATESELVEVQRRLALVSDPLQVIALGLEVLLQLQAHTDLMTLQELQGKLSELDLNVSQKIDSLRSTTASFTAFLTKHGVAHYRETFEKHGFKSEDDVLCSGLTGADLAEIGLADEEAQRLLAACVAATQ